MSVLCERPDSEFFHSVPDLHDAVHSFADNEVRSKLPVFGKLFVKHSVTKEFGLAMVHRHFDISKNEVLVETVNDEKSISVTSPWIIKGTFIQINPLVLLNNSCNRSKYRTLSNSKAVYWHFKCMVIV